MAALHSSLLLLLLCCIVCLGVYPVCHFSHPMTFFFPPYHLVFLLSLTLAGIKTNLCFLFLSWLIDWLIDWFIVWLSLRLFCMSSIAHFSPFFFSFFFFVRRYNTEGFYVLDFPSKYPVTQGWCSLFFTRCKKCSLQPVTHTNTVLRAFCGKLDVSFGSSLEGKISPVCGLGLWSSSAVPRTWRKHFLRSGALKEYLCECQAYDESLERWMKHVWCW